MSDKENLTENIKDIAKKGINWNTVLTAIPILSSILYAIARFIQYWVEVSYLNFWRIPSEFMHTNDKSFIYNLVTIICTVTVATFISYYIYQIWGIIKSSKKCKFKKVLYKILFIGTVFLSLFFIISLLFSLYLMSRTDRGTFITALSVVIHDGEIMFLFAFLSTIFTMTLFCLGSAISPRTIKTSSKSSNYSENKHKKRKKGKDKKVDTKKRKIITKCVLGFIIIGFIVGYSVYLYTVLLQQYKNTTAFEIIEGKYVLLYKDTENLVIKQCLIDDNSIYIDNDAYQLIDAKNAKIKTIQFNKNGEEPVFKRLSSDEFQKLIAETNSNEDTPS